MKRLFVVLPIFVLAVLFANMPIFAGCNSGDNIDWYCPTCGSCPICDAAIDGWTSSPPTLNVTLSCSQVDSVPLYQKSTNTTTPTAPGGRMWTTAYVNSGTSNWTFRQGENSVVSNSSGSAQEITVVPEGSIITVEPDLTGPGSGSMPFVPVDPMGEIVCTVVPAGQTAGGIICTYTPKPGPVVSGGGGGGSDCHLAIWICIAIGQAPPNVCSSTNDGVPCQ